MNVMSQPRNVRIYCMSSGTALFDSAQLTIGKDPGTPIECSIQMYLIDHPDGPVLFETGFDPQVASDPAGYLGPEIASLWKPKMREEDAVVHQLERLDYRPEDIKYVILSALYMDHAGGMKYFPQSTFIVQRAELKMAWWPDPCVGGYNYNDIKDTREFKFIQLDSDYDVFNDGTVVVKRCPCHAIGEQVLIVRLKGGTIVNPTGVIPLRRNYELDAIPGVLMVSPGQAYANMQKLKRIIAKERAKVLYHHDLTEWRTCKKLPDYYE